MAACSSSSSLIDDDEDETSVNYYVDHDAFTTSDTPLLDNFEFCAYKGETDTVFITSTIMPYERVGRKKNGNYKTCPHCERTVTELYRGKFGCTLECSLGMVVDQRDLYNIIHAFIARDYNMKVKAAPPMNQPESTESFWKWMFNFHYEQSDPRSQHLREQFQKNEYTHESFEAVKKAR